jgi:thymidylate synthase (FAD)
MKITIVEPSVEIISPLDGILEHLEIVGRVSHKSEGRIGPSTAEPFVRKIRDMGHYPVLEHATVSTRIICSRSCSHQLVRHRIASYCQESQRYCNYGKLGFQVICPPSIGLPAGEYEGGWDDGLWEFNPLFNAVLSSRQFDWLHTVGTAYNEYLDELAEGILPEDAREVLPNATKTEIIATMNLSQWRHVFHERALSPRAQYQIRTIMATLLGTLQTALPAVFDDLEIS